jgi:hypothetical protein
MAEEAKEYKVPTPPPGVRTIPREEYVSTARAEEDNWKHRAIGMRCHTCMFFVLKSTGLNSINPAGRLGRCRKHSPTLCGWPALFEQDWCGDHKLDENKC